MHPLVRCLPWLALAAAPCARAQPPAPSAYAPPGFEVMPFIGYRSQGKFEIDPDAEAVELRDDVTVGATLNFRIDELSQYELFFGRQSTTVSPDPPAGRVDITSDYLHLGGTLILNDEQQLKPYIAGGLGVTRLRAGGGGEETKFSISLAGGVRVPLKERLALRIEARGFLTLIDTDSRLFCTSDASGGACLLRSHGSTFVQYEVLAGIAIAF
jgi:opacity protein-like surface antigen